MGELPLKKLIDGVSVGDLRNTREMNNLLTVLKKKKQNLNVEKEKLRVVICCSAEDSDTGISIKEMLANFEIESFVASNGIDMPEKVIKRLINVLDKLDVFIPLLSDNFKNSDYCSQELGAAYFKNILIIPLSLDETAPYGFISGYRSPPVDENNAYLDHILKLMADYFPSANIHSKLIRVLKKADNWGMVEDAMRNLELHFDKLDDEESNALVEISTQNSYIQASNLCKGEYLPKFIEINKDKIEKDKLELILRLIQEEDEIGESRILGGEILDPEN